MARESQQSKDIIGELEKEKQVLFSEIELLKS